jgi:plastocyanin
MKWLSDLERSRRLPQILGACLVAWASFSHSFFSVNNIQTGGSVRGRVRIESKIQSKSMALNLYSRRGISSGSSQSQPPINELENVVLYLEGQFTDPFDPSAKNPMILQTDETFVPHVLPIIRGTTVNFPNADPFFHNVFSLSSAKSFDLGRYPKNQVRSVRFDRAGIVKVFCHIHSHMSAVVLVFDHPYFTQADAGGGFRIEAIPPGAYELVAWHERLKPQKTPLIVGSGTDVRVDLVL